MISDLIEVLGSGRTKRRRHEWDVHTVSSCGHMVDAESWRSPRWQEIWEQKDASCVIRPTLERLISKMSLYSEWSKHLKFKHEGDMAIIVKWKKKSLWSKLKKAFSVDGIQIGVSCVGVCQREMGDRARVISRTYNYTDRECYWQECTVVHLFFWELFDRITFTCSFPFVFNPAVDFML